MAGLNETAARYVEELRTLSGMMGFDKAYGLIVGNLINDDTYVWNEKRIILECLRSGWIETVDTGLSDDLESFFDRRDSGASPLVEDRLNRLLAICEAAMPREDYLRAEEAIGRLQNAAGRESFKKGFTDGVMLMVDLTNGGRS